MAHFSTIFHQVILALPRWRFDQAVAEHQGDRRVRTLPCWTQFTALLFAQLSGRQTLRDLEQGFNSQANHFYHLGVQPIHRSTLAEANAQRPVAFYEKVFGWLLDKLRAPSAIPSDELILLLDSTTISLNKTHFSWAQFRSTKAGVKILTVYDPTAQRPVYYTISNAKLHDHQSVQSLPFQPGVIYVFDRAYNDYAWYHRLHLQGSGFVGRMKSNALFEVVETKPTAHPNVMDDQIIRFSATKAKQNCPIPLRRIRYRRPENGKKLVFIANDLLSDPMDIAELYKKRWQIELFFKWIKQNLKIKRFLGTSENAVRIQIIVALIAYLLLQLAHAALPGVGSKSLQQLTRWVAVNLMQRRFMTDFLADPPIPISWQDRRLNPQLALPFA